LFCSVYRNIRVLICYLCRCLLLVVYHTLGFVDVFHITTNMHVIVCIQCPMIQFTSVLNNVVCDTFKCRFSLYSIRIFECYSRLPYLALFYIVTFDSELHRPKPIPLDNQYLKIEISFSNSAAFPLSPRHICVVIFVQTLEHSDCLFSHLVEYS
jgi:hypothetical protein